MANLERRWRITPRKDVFHISCSGIGNYYAVIKKGSMAALYPPLSNVFFVRPSHPKYEKYVRGWRVGVDPNFKDLQAQLKEFGGIKWLSFWSPNNPVPHTIEFIRKLPDLRLVDSLLLRLEQKELAGEKPKPKRKRAPRKKTPAKPRAKARAKKAPVKTEKPEGDSAPEGEKE